MVDPEKGKKKGEESNLVCFIGVFGIWMDGRNFIVKHKKTTGTESYHTTLIQAVKNCRRRILRAKIQVWGAPNEERTLKTILTFVKETDIMIRAALELEELILKDPST